MKKRIILEDKANDAFLRLQKELVRRKGEIGTGISPQDAGVKRGIEFSIKIFNRLLGTEYESNSEALAEAIRPSCREGDPYRRKKKAVVKPGALREYTQYILI